MAVGTVEQEENGAMGTTRIAIPTPPRYGWQEDAACKGLDAGLFFGDDQERPGERRARERVAKKVCLSCPVRRRCHEHAMSVPERRGVWAGLGETERAALLREQEQDQGHEREREETTTAA
ncbi:WhiB family transcriptional regulator [Embleya sp. NBC_00896]|uniref:WhiB family transcriptional regulator n=1 Tax=Embleya sp. NBC_00896 TaxID=2975961 RepID=UPI003865726A|nr:WhiB family transcriptional regulator [Embleya sp. NBC_00896]